MFFFSLFSPITYGVGYIITGIKEYYEYLLNEGNYPDYQNIYEKSIASTTLFAGIFLLFIFGLNVYIP